jgi:Bacterial EndoU nuclease
MCKPGARAKPKKEPVKSSTEKAKEAAETARLEKLQEAEAHWDNIRVHVMLGEVRTETKGQKKEKTTRIVGFHSIKCLGQKGCVVRIGDDSVKENLGGNGCYLREVSSLQGTAKKPSTFFPDTWTEADIKAVVVSAYLNKRDRVGRGTNRHVVDFPIRFLGQDTAFPHFEGKGEE